MSKSQSEVEIIKQMNALITKAKNLGPWLEGNLLKNKRVKYQKKDGSFSYYDAAPILQYKVGSGKRKSKRIPKNQVADIELLLEKGKEFKRLLSQYKGLAATLALDVKKK